MFRYFSISLLIFYSTLLLSQEQIHKIETVQMNSSIFDDKWSKFILYYDTQFIKIKSLTDTTEYLCIDLLENSFELILVKDSIKTYESEIIDCRISSSLSNPILNEIFKISNSKKPSIKINFLEVLEISYEEIGDEKITIIEEKTRFSNFEIFDYQSSVTMSVEVLKKNKLKSKKMK